MRIRYNEANKYCKYNYVYYVGGCLMYCSIWCNTIQYNTHQHLHILSEGDSPSSLCIRNNSHYQQRLLEHTEAEFATGHITAIESGTCKDGKWKEVEEERKWRIERGVGERGRLAEKERANI